MSTVPQARNIDDCDGFIKAHYQQTQTDGKRLYMLEHTREVQRIIDGYACPDCLCKFKQQRTTCPLCPWERNLARDIVEEIPAEWLPSPPTVTNDFAA